MKRMVRARFLNSRLRSASFPSSGLEAEDVFAGLDSTGDLFSCILFLFLFFLLIFLPIRLIFKTIPFYTDKWLIANKSDV